MFAGVPTWESLIPPTRGRLPFGEPVHRTEPSGPLDAPIVMLGVYPAATRHRTIVVDGEAIKLPAEVERTSCTVAI